MLFMAVYCLLESEKMDGLRTGERLMDTERRKCRRAGKGKQTETARAEIERVIKR